MTIRRHLVPATFALGLACCALVSAPRVAPAQARYVPPDLTRIPRAANTVFAGPASGAAAAPTFRALTAADVPGGGGSLAIGGSIASGTAGRVLYEGAGPALADSASLTFSTLGSDGRLGLGSGLGATLLTESSGDTLELSLNTDLAGLTRAPASAGALLRLDARGPGNPIFLVAREAPGGSTWTNPLIVTTSDTVVVGSAAGTDTPLGTLDVYPNATTAKGLVVRLPASATGNALEVQDSSGNAKLQVGPDGTIAGQATTGGTLTLRALSGGSGLTLDNTGSAQLPAVGAAVSLGSSTSTSLSTAGLNLNSSSKITWSTGGHYWDAQDTGLARAAPGVVKVTNASTGSGVLAAAGFAPAIAAKTAAYTLTTSDSTIVADATAGAFALTLPAANSVQAGRIFVAKKTDAGANAITLTAAGTDTIDGAGTYALSAQWKFVQVQSDGTSKWMIVGQNLAPVLLLLPSSRRPRRAA